MGQKVHPHLLRIGIIRSWESSWFASRKKYAEYLHQDLKIKEMIKSLLKNCGIANVEIERTEKSVTININTSKPGVIVGKNGDNISKIKAVLESHFKEIFTINIKEIKKPEVYAELMGQNIAQQIEKRIAYRRAVKSTIEKIREAGAIGVKVKVSGRLNGAEIARREFFKEGNIPLHTFRADINYARVRAFTTYGTIGIQVWIYTGEKFKEKVKAA